MSKKTLNKANLEALGADRLAALLIEVSTGSAEIKRRLRLELSHSLGASELAREVSKRLTALRKSTGFVSWRKRKALIKDLDTQVVMIVEKIAPEDATIAFDLLWRFIELAPSVYERVDDSRGDVGTVFRSAVLHFESIAPLAQIDPAALAERVWTVVQDNGYGAWDGIIPLMAPALGATGLARLKAEVEAYAAAPLEEESEDHEAIQFLRQLREGNSYAADRKKRFVQGCLQEIAASSGDTNAYIAQYSEEDLKRKDIAAEVAGLLLTEGRAEAAVELLLAADRDASTAEQEVWDDVYIACLEALGQSEQAQAHRWASFSASLNARHLRDYLKALPDFDDVEAEDLAMTHVAMDPDFSRALRFCIDWPDLLTAARLIEDRAAEIDGDRFLMLGAAAEALRSRHPRAAVLLWRAMIDTTLSRGRSAHYGQAAELLAECSLLDAQITDYGAFLSHESYIQTLQDDHGHKSSFWAKVHEPGRA
jgi:hypothetical protein